MSARWLNAGSAALADLQSEIERAANMLRQPGTYTPEDVLAALLPAAKETLEIAGIAPEEAERAALHKCLSDYLETPARPDLVKW